MPSSDEMVTSSIWLNYFDYYKNISVCAKFMSNETDVNFVLFANENDFINSRL